MSRYEGKKYKITVKSMYEGPFIVRFIRTISDWSIIFWRFFSFIELLMDFILRLVKKPYWIIRILKICKRNDAGSWILIYEEKVPKDVSEWQFQKFLYALYKSDGKEELDNFAEEIVAKGLRPLLFQGKKEEEIKANRYIGK